MGAECWIAPEITAGPAAAPPFLPLSAAAAPAADAEGTTLTLDSKDLLIPETNPPVKVSSKPKGLPRAKTCCPTRREEAVSLLSIGRSFEKKSSPPPAPAPALAPAPPRRRRTAKSWLLSNPTTAASTALRLPSGVWATTRATVGPGERIPPEGEVVCFFWKRNKKKGSEEKE